MENQSLSTRALRGVLWTGSSVAIQLVVNFLFYKWLPLETLGQFEAVLPLVVFLALVADLGLGSALVQYRDPSDDHFNSAFWTNLLVGLSITTALIVLAPTIARLSFIEDFTTDPNPEQFAQVLIYLSLFIPFAAVSGVVRAPLQRSLNFSAIAKAEIFAVVCAALAGIFTFLGNLIFLVPIANALAREIAHLGGLWRASTRRLRLRLNTDALRQLLPFGLNTTGANCANHLRSRLDSFFIVIFSLGDVNLALYAFAYRFTMMPLTRAATTITRVSFPAFSTIQEDDALLRRIYLKSVQSIALFSWPFLTGLLIFAPEILHFTKIEMLPAVDAFRLLCVAGMFKSVGTVVGSVYLAKGKADWAFRWTLATLILLFPGLYYGIHYGGIGGEQGEDIAGIAAVVAAFALLALPVSQYLVNRLIGLDFTTYLKAFGRPLLVTATVLVVLLLSRPFLGDDPLVRFILALVLGLLSYLLALRLFAWSLIHTYVQRFRGQST